MPMAPETVEKVQAPEEAANRRLFRSSRQSVIAGVAGGLGEYFGVDPVWFRVAFVVLTLGGGSGILVYGFMWLIVPLAPAGDSTLPGPRGAVTGSVVIGVVFMAVGTIALVNTIAPTLGQYFWPVAFVIGGLALVTGGMNRDDAR